MGQRKKAAGSGARIQRTSKIASISTATPKGSDAAETDAALNPALNSVIAVSPTALAEADALDAEFKKTGKLVGPMHCVTVLPKDNIDTDDMPTTAGSAAMITSQPETDSYIDKKIRDAGGIIIGKANLDEFAFGFSPRTGDGFVDAQLGDINVFASGNKDGFIDDVVVSFGAPRYLVREYYYDRRWAPGDIYYACAIAYQLRRPCVEILDLYERDHGQGWGVIAQRLGIKPGSPAFHALKGRVGQGHG